MKKFIQFSALFLAFFCLTHTTYAQKHITKNGHISFFSEAELENIEAHNNQATSIFNAADGQLVFMVLMKGFQFEKALMQEHFNEKYVESDKYPKATFKGSIANMDEIKLKRDGDYPANVSGKLTIHGVTQSVETEGTITVKNGKIGASATFPVKLADYDISIPSVVKDNIAKTVEIRVEIDEYKAM